MGLIMILVLDKRRWRTVEITELFVVHGRIVSLSMRAALERSLKLFIH